MEQQILKQGRVQGSKDKAQRKPDGYILRYAKKHIEEIKDLKKTNKFLNGLIDRQKKIYDTRLKGYVKDFFKTEIDESLLFGNSEMINLEKKCRNSLIKDFIELWYFYQTESEYQKEQDELDDEMFKDIEKIFEEKNKA